MADTMMTTITVMMVMVDDADDAIIILVILTSHFSTFILSIHPIDDRITIDLTDAILGVINNHKCPKYVFGAFFYFKNQFYISVF